MRIKLFLNPDFDAVITCGDCRFNDVDFESGEYAIGDEPGEFVGTLNADRLGRGELIELADKMHAIGNTLGTQVFLDCLEAAKETR